MIYLFENPNNNASVVYDETTLTEAQKAKGVAVSELPEPQTPQGKQAILKVKKSTGEVWYDYIDAPIDEKTEIEQLKADNLTTLEALAEVYEMLLALQ